MRKKLEKLRSADELVKKLLILSTDETVCLLDSCGVSHLGSRFLMAGVLPLETIEISNDSADKTLEIVEKKLSDQKLFAIFTISYDFGLKLNKLEKRSKETADFAEPDVFLALFECLVIYDYELQETCLFGNENRFAEIEKLLDSTKTADFNHSKPQIVTPVRSNFTKPEYLAAVEEIKERIRCGDTYQTNLTQQFTADLPDSLTPQNIFYRLRRDHPAPFASFIKRHETTVISASPERFFAVQSKIRNPKSEIVTVSPIKGTRPRGKTAETDEKLRRELLNSAKDRAENIMIVDLLRNDLGRVAEFGTVTVEKLCNLEEHPTLFHLVSTVNAELRPETSFSDIIRAVFPCGSITGAPKIRTMQIIDDLETADRGLSMGAIGFFGQWAVGSGQWAVEDSSKSTVQLVERTTQIEIENKEFEYSTAHRPRPAVHRADFSVAIRTMVIKNACARFNVGGGIVIDSIPEDEYAETLTKAKALLNAINGELKF